VSQQAKTGSWQRINNSQNSDLLTKDVFLLKISHGNKVSDGQYQYTLLPAKTVAQTQQYAKSPAVEILQNNSSIQAVYHKGLNTSGMVFYQAGTTELASGLVLSVDKPCIVLLEEKHQQVVVSVSVPDVLAQRVEVNLAYPNQNIVKETFVMPTTVDTLGMSITKIIPIK
jgi:hypothetical protein